MSGLKLLFLSTKATRPSHRFRVEQMLPFLERRGYRCSVAFFPKNPFQRLWFYRQLPQFDAVLIQQRTLDPIELKIVRNLSKYLLFDMDDSIMFDGEGQVCNRRSRRFDAMIYLSDLVICGNSFLCDQAKARATFMSKNLRIEMIPTAIDTDRFRPDLFRKTTRERVTIGWTGSRSTNPYLNAIFPFLANVRGLIELKVISDTTEGLDFSQLGQVPHRFVDWSAKSEVEETAEFEIGLMPLPENNATRGKCGCKALQYMALGIPAVCSPVGVNREIIQHGMNGFLEESADGWRKTLDRLVSDFALRERIGKAGRATVEHQYALRVIASQLSDLLDQTTKSSPP